MTDRKSTVYTSANRARKFVVVTNLGTYKDNKMFFVVEIPLLFLQQKGLQCISSVEERQCEKNAYSVCTGPIPHSIDLVPLSVARSRGEIKSLLKFLKRD